MDRGPSSVECGVFFRARGSGTDRFITLYSAKAYSGSAWLQKLQPTSTEFSVWLCGRFQHTIRKYNRFPPRDAVRYLLVRD